MAPLTCINLQLPIVGTSEKTLCSYPIIKIALFLRWNTIVIIILTLGYTHNHTHGQQSSGCAVLDQLTSWPADHAGVEIAGRSRRRVDCRKRASAKVHREELENGEDRSWTESTTTHIHTHETRFCITLQQVQQLQPRMHFCNSWTRFRPTECRHRVSKRVAKSNSWREVVGLVSSSSCQAQYEWKSSSSRTVFFDEQHTDCGRQSLYSVTWHPSTLCTWPTTSFLPPSFSLSLEDRKTINELALMAASRPAFISPWPVDGATSVNLSRPAGGTTVGRLDGLGWSSAFVR